MEKRKANIPEVDQVAWMDAETTLRKINEAQQVFTARVCEILTGN